MTRFVTKLAAATAAFTLVAAPGVASAQDNGGVDEQTGPVAYANAAGTRVTQNGQTGGGTVITETQRSPLRAGTSMLSQDRAVIPKDDGEKQSVGPNYVLHFGKFGEQSPLPASVPGREHKVTASLAENTVPSASAEATYALQDNGLGGAEPVDNTVLVLQDSKSTVECAGKDAATGATTAEQILVRGAGGELAPVDLPAPGASLELSDLPFGSPVAIEQGAESAPVTSDLTVSRLTAFDDLIRQDQWRGGDVTAAAGWKVEIVSHVPAAPADEDTGSAEDEQGEEEAGGQTSAAEPAEPESARADAEPAQAGDITTTLVLGGVSCSTGEGFAPVAAGAGGGQPKARVPVKIPAGDAEIARATSAAPEDSAAPLGLALLTGGMALGTAAAFLLRRRRAVTSSRPDSR